MLNLNVLFQDKTEKKQHTILKPQITEKHLNNTKPIIDMVVWTLFLFLNQFKIKSLKDKSFKHLIFWTFDLSAFRSFDFSVIRSFYFSISRIPGEFFSNSAVPAVSKLPDVRAWPWLQRDEEVNDTGTT